MHDISTEALEAHIDQASNVRSVLWAMSRLLAQDGAAARASQASWFELQQLSAAGLRLADEFIDSMQDERALQSES